MFQRMFGKSIAGKSKLRVIRYRPNYLRRRMRHTTNKWQIEESDHKVKKTAMLFGECEGLTPEARA